MATLAQTISDYGQFVMKNVSNTCSGVSSRMFMGLAQYLTLVSEDTLLQNFSVSTTENIGASGECTGLIQKLFGYLKIDSCIVRISTNAQNVYGVIQNSNAKVFAVNSQVHFDCGADYLVYFGRFGMNAAGNGTVVLENVVFGFTGMGEYYQNCFKNDYELMLDGELTNVCI